MMANLKTKATAKPTHYLAIWSFPLIENQALKLCATMVEAPMPPEVEKISYLIQFLKLSLHSDGA